MCWEAIPHLRGSECNGDVMPTMHQISKTTGANILGVRIVLDQRMMSGKWLEKHPWLVAFGALLCSLANAYEAVYVRPNSLMSIVDWAFALVGFLAFLGLLLSALSDHFYRPEGQ
jgi:hypothetical protein